MNMHDIYLPIFKIFSFIEKKILHMESAGHVGGATDSYFHKSREDDYLATARNDIMDLWANVPLTQREAAIRVDEAHACLCAAVDLLLACAKMLGFDHRQRARFAFTPPHEDRDTGLVFPGGVVLYSLGANKNCLAMQISEASWLVIDGETA